MGEAFTGDIPSFLKSEKDEENENKVLNDWVKALPSPFCTELSEIFKEINEQKTQESKLFKALDKLEAAISHNEADLSTWIELEYELNPVYGKEESQFSEYTKSLQNKIYTDSIKKIIDKGEN
jgi:putative hydrolase of HD superfamily